MEKEILYGKRGGVGILTLHRPNKLNALNPQMIEELSRILREAEADPDIRLLVLEGSGDRAFCAGGDIRTAYERCLEGKKEEVMCAFRKEYEVDLHLARYSKPILTYMNGITMGGGVGLSINTDFRLVNESTRWAMPEMKIGFFPDVGVSYHLSRLSYGIGEYLALTSASIGADDCIFLDFADIKIRSEDYASIKEEIVHLIEHYPSSGDIRAGMEEFFRKYALPREIGETERQSKNIEAHFYGKNFSELLASLRSDAEDDFSKKVLQEFEENSPLSMRVTLEQLKKSRNKTFEECLEQDLILVRRFTEEHDFYTGIRTKMIEKREHSDWSVSLEEEIPQHRIDCFFD